MRSLRDCGVTREVGERSRQRMGAEENIRRALRDEADAQVHLMSNAELRDFQEERAAISQHMCTADRQGVVTNDAGMGDGEFRRPVGRGITIVPALCEMASGLSSHRRVELFVKAQEHTVVADFMSDEDRRTPDVADALEATVVGGVGLPACDTADV